MARRSTSAWPWLGGVAALAVTGVGVGVVALTGTAPRRSMRRSGAARPEPDPRPQQDDAMPKDRFGRTRPAPPTVVATPPDPPPAPPRKLPAGIDPAVVARIDQYSDLIDRIAREEQVSPAEVRGLIAAESRGRTGSVSAGGYKGLMQAGREDAEVDPATSVRHGAKKMRDFSRQLATLARGAGLAWNQLDRWTRLRWLVRAFNAGPGVIGKALEYARTAGDVTRWMEAPAYERALLHHGSYSFPQSKREEGNRWRTKLDHRNLTLAQARAEGAPSLLFDAIHAKWQHTAEYVENVVAYARYYDPEARS